MPRTQPTPTSPLDAMVMLNDLPDWIDLFAGPGGWDVAATDLGQTVLGVEWDQAACDTRRAAGLPTIQGDVRDFGPGTAFFKHLMRRGGTRGFIASPPCQTFSMAGNGSGRGSIDELVKVVHDMTANLIISRPLVRNLMAEHDMDDRSTLVVEPLRWILAAHIAGRPFRYIALEQVPTVLPVWEAYSDALATIGYTVNVAILNAEQYGVPQTRKRAVLVAELDGYASLPLPTHSRYYSRDPQRLDEGVQPWVPMAEALGWGYKQRPAPTVTSGGARTGGAEPFTKQPREAMIRASLDSSQWAMRSNYSGPPSATRRTAAERGRGLRPLDAPAFAVTSKVFDFTGPDSARVRPTVAEVATLQTFPADHPWQGGKGKQHEQIGNAVPPVLAGAVLGALAGSALVQA